MMSESLSETPRPRRTMRWILRLVVLALVGVPVWLAVDWWFFPSRPAIEAKEVESVTVDIEGWEEEQRHVTESTDSDAIAELLRVVSTSARASDHKCASRVYVEFHIRGGTRETVRFLPGHDEAYYEYRYGSRINRVEREAFLNAMRMLGVKRLPLDAQGKTHAI